MTSATRRALLLDLDNTLYDEETYVFSGFEAVAETVSRSERNIGKPEFFDAMLEEYHANGRGRVFDQALAAFGLAQTPDRIADLVGIYRAHYPRISLYEGAGAVLSRLTKTDDLAIVTDGLGSMQRLKVDALGLSRWSKVIIYCWELGAPKPRTEGYSEALRQLGHSRSSCVIVGDNPAHDMIAAHRLNVPSIRVGTGRFAHAPNDPTMEPTVRIAGIGELEDALDHLHCFAAA